MAIERRAFLGALALAPAALAGCATAAKRAEAQDGEPPLSPSAPSAEAAGGALAAVRDYPLGAGVEPAHVFRAAAARP